MNYQLSDIISGISQVGFPIVISLLLLIRIESKMEKFGDKMEKVSENLDKNTNATEKLSTVINERLPRRK
ncbi:MAG: YvrJ family protein [Patescibacteria group bacterium]|nr:YvrJ family protein [Patescibacteria group bacterium]MDE2015882.1 YvrJ family protein [Patescibacteria group bacterium]MDE2233519.1 YvrJ family protein [Patescibacteria group bacterium]